MSKPQDVVNFRRRIKIALVEAFGARCQKCGETFPYFVYDFHHLDPATKSFGLGNASTTRARSAYADEAKKCIMVCANCHRVIEYEELDISEISCAFDEEKYYMTLENLANENKEKVNDAKRNASTKPSREELKMLIRNAPFAQIANKYSVSDASIRRWCKNYNLPSRVADIKEISDDNWVDI